MDHRIEYAAKAPAADDPALGGDDLLAGRAGVELDCWVGLRKLMGGRGFDKGPGSRRGKAVGKIKFMHSSRFLRKECIED